MTHLEVWVPALPATALSPNGGKRSRRNPWELSNAKLELGDVAYHAVLGAYAPNIPHFEPRVIITCTLYAWHNRRNGDGLYRPTDPSNLGGDVLKPLIDYGLVRHGIIDDDDYTVVQEVRLRIGHVGTLAEEGIMLEVDGD
jgi:hypothetical protein